MNGVSKRINETQLSEDIPQFFEDTPDCFLQHILDMPISEIINNIIEINTTIASFWKNSAGWAPSEAAKLL